MTPADLRAFRKRLGLTQTEAAEAMGLTKQAIYLYESGRNPIPRLVELACEAIEAKAQPAP